MVTIKALIASIGTNPAALELLAERQHELSNAQRTAVLKAFTPPKEPKAAKAAKVAMPAVTAPSRDLCGARQSDSFMAMEQPPVSLVHPGRQGRLPGRADALRAARRAFF